MKKRKKSEKEKKITSKENEILLIVVLTSILALFLLNIIGEVSGLFLLPVAPGILVSIHLFMGSGEGASIFSIIIIGGISILFWGFFMKTSKFIMKTQSIAIKVTLLGLLLGIAFWPLLAPITSYFNTPNGDLQIYFSLLFSIVYFTFIGALSTFISTIFVRNEK